MRSNQLLTGVVLAFSLLFSGCMGVYYEEYYEPNTLVVKNDYDAAGNIWSVYVTPSSAPSWGSDLLGGDILQPGDELLVDIYDCDRYYDIRVEYDGFGPAVEAYDVWLPCRTTTIVPFMDW